MGEKWKKICFGEMEYFISNKGRVKGIRGLLLKQRMNKDGYLEVTVGKGRHRTRGKVHRLVAIAFIKRTDGYNEINHKDFNRQNNVVDNLEWCTHSYNIKYSIKNNKSEYFLNRSKGENNPKAKFKKDQILEIRKLYDNGYRICEIAKKYKRGYSTIFNIVKYKTWNF